MNIYNRGGDLTLGLYSVYCLHFNKRPKPTFTPRNNFVILIYIYIYIYIYINYYDVIWCTVGSYHRR